MPKFQTEIPEELMTIIKDEGYDLHSYFFTIFMRPLLEKHRVRLEQEVIEKVKVEIDTKIETVKDAVTVEVEKAEAVPDVEPTPEPTPDPEPVEEPPAEEVPVKP